MSPRSWSREFSVVVVLQTRISKHCESCGGVSIWNQSHLLPAIAALPLHGRRPPGGLQAAYDGTEYKPYAGA